LIRTWAYFVAVSGFEFQFVTLDQLRECLTYYEQCLLPTSREPDMARNPEKGEWQSWQERLPLYLREEPKRLKVVAALSRALEEFITQRD
jgi:hypothetical protein